MNKKKMMALQLLIEGNLNKKEISSRLNIDVSTLHRWEQESEFKKHMEQCIAAVRESITKNLTLLAERLLESISKSASELPPKESLELLLKILDKGDRLGLCLLTKTERQNDDVTCLTDNELKETIMRYLAENTDEELE
jgi:hypothetical protein